MQAATFIEELGFREVCIEGDALIVIKSINAVEEDKSRISNLIIEIKGRTPNFRSS